MQWVVHVLVEDIRPLLWVIALGELLLLIAAAGSRQGRFVVFMALLAAMVPLLVLLDWLVVTDRERAEAVVEAVVEAVRDEDVDSLLRHLAPQCRYGRFDREGIGQIARLAFDRYDIEWMRVGRRRTRMLRLRRQAAVEFAVVAVGREGEVRSRPYPTRWRLTLSETAPDRWQVVAINQLPALPGRERPQRLPGLPRP